MIYSDLKLSDIIEILPSFKRIVISIENISNMEPICVGLYKKSKEYSSQRNLHIEFISPEFDSGYGLPYLLIQIKE